MVDDWPRGFDLTPRQCSALSAQYSVLALTAGADALSGDLP